VRYNAIPWAEFHAVIDGFRSVLVPGRLWFGDNAGDGDEGALLFIPGCDAFDGHIVKIGAQLRLHVPDSRFPGKEALYLVADNVGIGAYWDRSRCCRSLEARRRKFCVRAVQHRDHGNGHALHSGACGLGRLLRATCPPLTRLRRPRQSTGWWEHNR
jgi:hypothetical protein